MYLVPPQQPQQQMYQPVTPFDNLRGSGLRGSFAGQQPQEITKSWAPNFMGYGKPY
jgi:hypothetical protein